MNTVELIPAGSVLDFNHIAYPPDIALLTRDLLGMINDARWEIKVAVMFADGSPIAALPIRSLAKGTRLPHPLDSICEHLHAVQQREMLVIGGSGGLVRGAWVATGYPLSVIPKMLTQLKPSIRKGTVLAPYLPDEQVAWFDDCLGVPNNQSIQAEEYSYFDLQDVKKYTDWVGLQTKKVRQTLNRDLRDCELLGGSFDAIPYSWSLLYEHLDLFADVFQKNDSSRHDMLVRQELHQFVEAAEAAEWNLVCLGYRSPIGKLDGLALGQECGTILDLAYLGLRGNIAYRREIYANFVASTPIKYCLERGLSKVLLGWSHADVKRRRGAVVSSLGHYAWKV